MYQTIRPRENPDGLGVAWFVPIIIAAVTAGGTILAARIARPSTPSQKERESLIKLQVEADIERMKAAQEQQEQLLSYALPAVGVVALVMLLR